MGGVWVGMLPCGDGGAPAFCPAGRGSDVETKFQQGVATLECCILPKPLHRLEVAKKTTPSPLAGNALSPPGSRQNNLQGFDLDLPLGKFIVVTGLSGAGKSSLVFDTIHAEGQRRYVETFSAYTRQFLDLLAKPRVDSVENIPPSIAIEQTNTVKTSRSTVGTMTELTDYAKVWFSHHASCFDPATGEQACDGR